jgi:hypothetical protein
VLSPPRPLAHTLALWHPLGQLAESRFDDAYAYLSTALAAFRTAHALQSSAAAVDGAHSRGDNKGVCDGGRRGDGDGDAVVASGAGGALEGRARKESEGGPRADVEDSSRTVQDCDGEAMGDLLGGGFSNGELACEAEMRELAVLLEEVKQAEASALLRVAQVCVCVCTCICTCVCVCVYVCMCICTLPPTNVQSRTR